MLVYVQSQYVYIIVPCLRMEKYGDRVLVSIVLVNDMYVCTFITQRLIQ